MFSRGSVRYWLISLSIGMAASIGLSVAVNATLTDRAVKAERAARLSSQQQQQQARIATCLVVVTQDAAFKAEPPVTDAGKQAAVAWHNLREQLRCDHT